MGESEPSTESESPAVRAAVVDDEPSVLRMVGRLLEREGMEVERHANAASALNSFRDSDGRIDVAIVDLYMPGMSGLELLHELRAGWPSVPVIMMTGKASVDSAVEAIKNGAYDFLVKPFDPIETLSSCVQRAVAHKQLVEKSRLLERQLDPAQRFQNIVGTSKSMRDVFSYIDSVAPTDATVLILGESGTGKELAARAVHDASERSGKPFVAVNCAALTETVLESELFGHVRGAFTGAIASRRGLFEEASGGTLFLDEIGELAPATQASLLRVLQEGEIRPVGSSTSRKVDVRVIAATHRDLMTEVKENRFRQDLFYRLNVISIRIPPLRERRDDIAQLAQHFLAKHGERFNKPNLSISSELLEVLGAYEWPGNVRELENAIERAIVLTRGEQLLPATLPPEVRAVEGTPPTADDSPLYDMPLKQARDEFERAYLEHLLQRADGNVAEAARIADYDPSNLRRVLKRHDIKT